MRLLQKLLGSRNDRLIKQYRQILAQVNSFEEKVSALSDDALQQKTVEFKERVQSGQTLDEILPEAFAVVRETAKRVLKERHYDVQILGGLALHHGKIAEMSTGEGKTLTSTLPCYLNALSGQGVHVVTVNSYLAQRDNEWMGQIYRFLGLSTGVIYTDMPQEERQKAYQADITYGTNNEFGFDYLRDNMSPTLEAKVQRGHSYAIIDEVDSILIDEARTPLIISGEITDSSTLYRQIFPLVKDLKEEKEHQPGHYTLSEKEKQVFLTDDGHTKMEARLRKQGILKSEDSLFSQENINLLHYVQASLRAQFMYRRDVDYIVYDNQVVIIDEHTGRAMPGRRWSDGLHQAIEAKEGVKIQNENQTLASITFQNYFLMYKKLSGMTGTADTEAVELHQIYNLEVVVIPTNKSVIRKDGTDMLYLTKNMKYQKIVEDIIEKQKTGQPVLVGTTSIENSELLSKLLKDKKIKHQVLNAKYHAEEAEIIAQAGCPNAVTIATNMAGRGTDIILGGNANFAVNKMKLTDPEKIRQLKETFAKQQADVKAVGGLYVLGTERHESRRIDNQLRGRSGRQGDPGASRFYLSLDDSLMRIFATDMTASVMQKAGMKEDEPLEHPWFNRIIEKAQRKVEGHHYDIRKQLLQFDNIANEQRLLIYEQRDELMRLDDVSDVIQSQAKTVFTDLVNESFVKDLPVEQWDIQGLESRLKKDFQLSEDAQVWVDQQVSNETIISSLVDRFMLIHQMKINQSNEDLVKELERSVLLRVLDEQWKDHLARIDHLRQGIHFRGYAQKNPIHEFKIEAFELFKQLLKNIKYEVISKLCTITIVDEIPKPVFDIPAVQEPKKKEKIARNATCPCGSGKKYKRCCGKL
tara:strand:- start:132 stop:2729 length:2598 start_codon:yes stop_codon:yes gene_type:complete